MEHPILVGAVIFGIWAFWVAASQLEKREEREEWRKKWEAEWKAEKEREEYWESIAKGDKK